jgi:hypothetical protein
MHGYWLCPDVLRKKLEEFNPFQLRWMTPYRDFYQIGLGQLLISHDGSKTATLSECWLAKMTIALGAGKNRQEYWRIEREEGFSISFVYRYYYYQPARMTGHLKGERPERIKLSSVEGESIWVLKETDPLVIVDQNGKPVPRFMSSVM